MSHQASQLAVEQGLKRTDVTYPEYANSDVVRLTPNLGVTVPEHSSKCIFGACLDKSSAIMIQAV